MTLNEAHTAILDAERTIQNADHIVYKVARICAERLRSSNVPCYVLKELKRELRDYNIHTGRWRD